MSTASLDNSTFHSEMASSKGLSFEEIYREYWSEIYLFAYNMLRDRDLAKDIVQEVFIPLINKEKRQKVQHFRAFLIQSVKFQIYTLVRSERVRLKAFEQLKLSEYDNSTDELLRERELSKQIELSVGSLPDKCRTIFKFKQEGHNAKAIAALTGNSQRTVEHQLYIASKKLRSSLENVVSLVLAAGVYLFL